MQIKLPDGSVIDADTGAIIGMGVVSEDKPTWNELAFKEVPCSMKSEPEPTTNATETKEIVMTDTVTDTVTENPIVNSKDVTTVTVPVRISDTATSTTTTTAAVTRDCQGWADALGIEKTAAYGLLRGLTAIGKCVETPAPRAAGSKGKNKVLYTLSNSLCAILLNQ